MDTLDQQIASRTDRGLLYLIAGLVGLLLLGGLAGRVIVYPKLVSGSPLVN